MQPYASNSRVSAEIASEQGSDARRERTARLLIETIRELARARSSQAIAKIVGRAATALVSADSTSLLLREGEGYVCIDEESALSVWSGNKRPFEECVDGSVMESGEQIAIPDIYADDRIARENFGSSFVRSMVLTPVRGSLGVEARGPAREQNRAVIGTFWGRCYQPSAEELRLLQDLADSTAIAAENAGLNAELERRVEVRTRELLNANRDLEAFSYSVAHDLRAPLSAMLVTRSILEHSYGAALDSYGVKLLQDIERSGRRMGELIGGLLQFARCARVELSKERLDLSAIAASLVMALRQQNLARKIYVHIEPGLVAYADRTLLEVVLENLLHNAFKYTRERELAEIRVGRASGEAPPAFFVRDNGVGFDRVSAKDLFLPFKRLHSSQRFEGHGVGLATVARIIDKHGGRIWAEPALEGGATFFFALPEGAS